MGKNAFQLVHNHSVGDGRSILCTDGLFHDERSIGRRPGFMGKPCTTKLYKTEAGAKRGLAVWNQAMADYCFAEQVA